MLKDGRSEIRPELGTLCLKVVFVEENGYLISIHLISGIRNLEFGIWNLEFGNWDREFRIWDLGFEHLWPKPALIVIASIIDY